MKKRQFLTALAAAATLPPITQATAKPSGPVLLTISGASVQPNRGKFDPGRDEMMAKHKVSFERAHVFDYAAIQALPAVTIKPTLEYDGKRHTLRGPLLLDVVAAATGKVPPDKATLLMRAVDGYVAALTVAQARALRYIVAASMDGEPMALGGVGPLWALYEPDSIPEMASKPLPDRYGSCPWGLYHIEIQA